MNVKWVVGLDLSLTGSAVTVIRDPWLPWRAGDWSRVFVRRYPKKTLARTASAHQKAERITSIADALLDDVAHAMGRPEGFPPMSAWVENYGFGAKNRGRDIAELGGVVKDRFLLRYDCVPESVTVQQARKLFLGVGSGDDIKLEVVRQLHKLGAPFARVEPGMTKKAMMDLTDACDSFLVANWGVSSLDLRAISIAR